MTIITTLTPGSDKAGFFCVRALVIVLGRPPAGKENFPGAKEYFHLDGHKSSWDNEINNLKIINLFI
ncbi:hypothetical protein MTHERMOG20_18940 [Moorella thermoacetica]|nr:hypothetical protein MTHERMOG20_18940 [Moorella thermoacetica]